MEIIVGKFVITPSLNSTFYDLNILKVAKSGKSEGQTSREIVGYDMSITKILQVISKEQVLEVKDIKTLEDLCLNLLIMTQKIGQQILTEIKNG